MNNSNVIPLKLHADIVFYRNGTDRWVAFIGLENNIPVEMVTFIWDENINISEIFNCNIIKYQYEQNRPVFEDELLKNTGEQIVINNITNTKPLTCS